MANNESRNRKLKIKEAIDILTQLALPRAQLNERTAYCLLALLRLVPSLKWSESGNPLVGITPMMEFARVHYGKNYAPNSRETFRRFSMHQLVQAGIALYNPDKPDRPVNSPRAVYQISPEALKVVKMYGTKAWKSELAKFKQLAPTLLSQYAREREMDMVNIKTRDGQNISLSPGKHSELIRLIIEEMAPRFLHGATLVYIGDTGDKWSYFDSELAERLGLTVKQHGKMPDIVMWMEDKKWLILIESVTSHGPVDSIRRIELEKLFYMAPEKIYISAFPNKRTFARFAPDVAWETEAWVADNPTHMVHFNGSRFLGPYI